MRRPFSVLVIAIFLLICPISPLAQDKPSVWSFYFSPHGGYAGAIFREINSAKSSTIFVQAYSFASAPLAEGLPDSYKKGGKVQILPDRSVGGIAD